jgi:recyclin-1
MVLDHLAVTDLIQCALVSKRMKEMVYDDTRWVRKLQAMGCWNEGYARAHAEEARRKQSDILHEVTEEEYEDTSNAKNGHVSSHGKTPSIVLSEAPEKTNSELLAEGGDRRRSQSNPVDGFDYVSLNSASPNMASSASSGDSSSTLLIMNKVRSIRGGARVEFGKVYAALRPFYKDAVRSKHPSNAKIFRVYRDPNQQAQMLSQMVRFAKSDFSQGHMQREKRLSFMVAAFEDAVAKEYEQGLRIGDVDGRMRKYAHVLVTLNGGQRAIDRFLSESSVLKDGPQLGDPMDCFNPSNPDLIFLDESHGFFGHLSAACNSEISVIQRVFPLSVNVVIPLLSRVGSEVIAPYLNKVLEHVRETSSEASIRAISGTYEQVLQFLSSLNSVPGYEPQQNETLNGIILDIYSPFVKLYFEDELESFRRKSEAEVTGWERQLSQQDASIESLYMSNINRQADKRDFLSSFRKVVMAPVNALPAFPFAAKPKTQDPLEATKSQDGSRSASPAPKNGNSISRASSPFTEPPTTELAAKAAIMKSRLEGIKSLFSLEVALSLVHMAKTSIERLAIFARVQGEFEKGARSQCEAVFILLLKTLGNRHVRAGFDQAVSHLSKYNPRAVTERGDQPGVAPLVVFLELVNVGDLIQQMLDVFYEQELVATKLTDRNDFLNPTVKEKKRFEQMLDERVAAGLNKGIEVLMAEVEYICATTQNVEDYNPGATGVAISKLIDVSPTNTAIWVVEVVSAHTKMIVGSTDKNMLDVFNQEVGLRLFNVICKHLKRQRISVTGAIRLIRYVNKSILQFQND